MACEFIDNNTRVEDPSVLFTYENLKDLDEREKLLYMRDKYCEAATCMGELISAKEEEVDDLEEDLKNASDDDKPDIQIELDNARRELLTMKDLRDGYRTNCTNLNQSLLSIKDGIDVDPEYFEKDRYGKQADPLSTIMRRSTPLGKLFEHIIDWEDNIKLELIPDTTPFNVAEVLDDIEKASFDDIDGFEPTEVLSVNETTGSITTGDDEKDIDVDISGENITPDAFNIPSIQVDDKVKPIKLQEIESKVDIDRFSSGCITEHKNNFFEHIMRSVDSSIDLQFKNSRLDNKTFAEVYASTINSAMQTAANLTIQEKEFEFRNNELVLKQRELELREKELLLNNSIKLESAKYDLALKKAQAINANIEIAIAKTKLPYDIASVKENMKLTKIRTKAALVEIGTAKIERDRLIATTAQIRQNTLDSRLGSKYDRDRTVAEIERTRTATRSERYNAVLKKYEAYYAKVRIAEEKATGSANRKVMSADALSKMKLASLHDEQRKTYIKTHRENILKIAKDMWFAQMDTAGVENMIVEGIKGPLMSSRLERAFIDAGI
jgi:hypothetical protein